eukprot:symbB.v1.2.009768.t1/scaffold629.1/size183697/5
MAPTNSLVGPSHPTLPDVARQLEWILTKRLPQASRVLKPATQLLNGQSWPFALHFLRRLDDNAVPPDLISFGAALDTLARPAAWRQAVALLHEVPARRLVADAALLASAIHACRRHWRQACALLMETLRQRLLSDAARSSNIVACGVAQQWQRALAILFLESNSSVVTYSSAISAMECAAQWRRALELLRISIDAEVSPDVVLLSSAISATEAAGGRWVHALQILHDAHHWKLQVNVVMLSAALSALEKGNEWQSALTLLSTFQGSADGIACNAAITACKQGIAWELALHFIPNATRNGYNAAMHSLTVCHLWRRCLQLLDDFVSTDAVTEGAIHHAFQAAHVPLLLQKRSLPERLQEVLANIAIEESLSLPVSPSLLRRAWRAEELKDGQMGLLHTRLSLSSKSLRWDFGGNCRRLTPCLRP